MAIGERVYLVISYQLINLTSVSSVPFPRGSTTEIASSRYWIYVCVGQATE